MPLPPSMHTVSGNPPYVQEMTAPSLWWLGAAPPGQHWKLGLQSWYCLHRVGEQFVYGDTPGSAVPLCQERLRGLQLPQHPSPSSIRGKPIWRHLAVTLVSEHFHRLFGGWDIAREVGPSPLPYPFFVHLLCFMGEYWEEGLSGFQGDSPSWSNDVSIWAHGVSNRTPAKNPQEDRRALHLLPP